jgi:hypothetical protein
MSIFEPPEARIDYSGWRCGGCDGELTPDGYCLPCQADFEDHIESLRVDIAERMDELMENLELTDQELEDYRRQMDQEQRKVAERPGETKETS